MAFELASTSAPKKLPEIHLKHALFLEDDEQFQQAEEEFIKAGKPKEAIDMHVHQLDWVSALRVAEEYEPSAVSDVYVAHARSLCDNGDLKGAEDLFIAALHPELALGMYQEVEAWQDALRIAQLHLPHRVAEINIAYQSAQARSGKGGSKKDFVATARGWEQSKQWIQAIDAYLAARKEVIDSIEDLEDLWDRAIEIARNHVPNKFVEVAVEVSRRLIALGREETAADILFEIGRQDEAVTICLTVKKFEKAKALAQGNASLKRRVDEAYQGHLVLQEDGTGELVELGRTDVALDVLAKRGDWDRVWEVAAKEKLPQATLAKYVVMRCEQVLLPCPAPSPLALPHPSLVAQRQCGTGQRSRRPHQLQARPRH
jgi:intraflagellar transport protein 172